ncbi:hypothetical protein ILUMI_18380 [Ignelater luminosus]|uniref:Uncharacterized protein n=1 Tax=Ignelater luminosus TaxID=2038154 RepID=A0A8K0CK03_IGNLU|nr:hypothetical protein ILUMI_18380 [Ignelater luminosus]
MKGFSIIFLASIVFIVILKEHVNAEEKKSDEAAKAGEKKGWVQSAKDKFKQIGHTISEGASKLKNKVFGKKSNETEAAKGAAVPAAA